MLLQFLNFMILLTRDVLKSKLSRDLIIDKISENKNISSQYGNLADSGFGRTTEVVR